MNGNPLPDFGATASGLAKNPLGIIALFIVLVYGLACLVLITGQSLSPYERVPIVYFLILFPIIVLGVFAWLVKSGEIFGPSDFQNEQNFMDLQRMRYTAVASLAVVRQKDHPAPDKLNFNEMVESVERVVNRVREGTENPEVLWVDDRPTNNVYERQALESVGIKFTLAETTDVALQILAHRGFGAIISDMGRREGPREGYVLLDALRSHGNNTPLFFYAGSNAAEHKRETERHGGQGCTNDGQELFEMVTNVVFGSKSARNRSVVRSGDHL